uniref:Uncharacterized protein n=1 Tax=Ciona savignyi TaxID=51511 RepID=H2Z089_CIOSA
MTKLFQVTGLVWFCSWFSGSQAWGSAADDATVLPIVLPIVGVVMMACIVGCCVQGRECVCCKEDQPVKQIAGAQFPRNAANLTRTTDVVLENEKTEFRSKQNNNSLGKLPGYSRKPLYDNKPQYTRQPTPIVPERISRGKAYINPAARRLADEVHNNTTTRGLQRSTLTKSVDPKIYLFLYNM